MAQNGPPFFVGQLVTDRATGRPRVIQSIDEASQTLVFEEEIKPFASPTAGLNRQLLDASSAAEAATQEDPSLLATLAAGFDPRTPEGRRNLAGTAGSIAGSMAATQAVGLLGGPPGTVAATAANVGRGVMLARKGAQIVGPVAGAAIAGGATNVVENLLSTPDLPPSPEMFGGPPRLEDDEPPQTGAPSRQGLVGAAGEFVRAGTDQFFPGGSAAEDFKQGAAEQSAYEVGGQVLALAIKSAGKRILGPFLTTQVTRSLKASRKEIQETLKVTLRAAREQVLKARDAGAAANRVAARLLGTTKAKLSRAAQRGFGGPPLFRGTALGGTMTEAGQAVAAIHRGAGRTVRQELGEIVGQAAEAGPPVDITVLKQEAQDVFNEQIRGVIQSFGIQGAPDDPKLVGIVNNLMNSGVLEGTARQAKIAELTQAGVDAAAAQLTVDQVSDPFFNKSLLLLRRFINSPDEVPFVDAHLLKRELGARSGDFSEVATQQVQQLTRKFRSGLSRVLDDASPEYREANAAFKAVRDILEAPAAQTLMSAAETAPEVLVKSLRQDAVLEARMWRDLLLEVAPQAGPQAESRARVSWDLLRSTWLKEHILKGNADKLSERLLAIPPDFAEVLYSDDAGRAYLRGVRQIADAYDSALSLARGAAERTEAAGLGRVRAAETNVRDTVADLAKEVSDEIKSVEFEFATSSLFKNSKRPIEFVGADVVKMAFLGPMNVWGAVATMRLIRGPKGADMIRWAALAPENTKLMVDALMGPAPGQAMGAMLKLPTFGAYLQHPTEHDLAAFSEAEDAVTGQLPPTPPSLISDPASVIAGLFSGPEASTTGGPPGPGGSNIRIDGLSAGGPPPR